MTTMASGAPDLVMRGFGGNLRLGGFCSASPMALIWRHDPVFFPLCHQPTRGAALRALPSSVPPSPSPSIAINHHYHRNHQHHPLKPTVWLNSAMSSNRRGKIFFGVITSVVSVSVSGSLPPPISPAIYWFYPPTTTTPCDLPTNPTLLPILRNTVNTR